MITQEEFCFITSLTVQPYKAKIEDYFNQVESLLESSKHEFIAIGRRTSLLKAKDYKSNISFCDSIADILKVI